MMGMLGGSGAAGSLADPDADTGKTFFAWSKVPSCFLFMNQIWRPPVVHHHLSPLLLHF